MSPHPAPAQPGALKIDWDLAVPRADRVRVKDHTCCCRRVYYELCQGGGLRFIRRYTQERKQVIVHESTWFPAAKTNEIWTHLLNGEAH
ncbi:hypothetical protein HNR40_005933 [Nonomuraea endophytica]|uniref:Uncharacterized protein n=1 Tax=Nonomuraea endophytica TaxID=714136 RepID=A0A7W8A6C9_9ACTN|nr:hypothetical protein [Nonomuraea endophytica]